jgi:hypothetical protein
VMVCWDPTSRASWDALRAWVSLATWLVQCQPCLPSSPLQPLHSACYVGLKAALQAVSAAACCSDGLQQCQAGLTS